MCIEYFILLLTKIGVIVSQDLAFLDLGVLEGATNQVESRSIPRVHKYVDIYTNVPDVEKVLNTYNTIKDIKRKSDSTGKNKVGSAQNINRNDYGYNIHRGPRPRFKTSKQNFTETMETALPFTNIQKIPKKRPLQPLQKTQASINEILKKYIAKLYAQKQITKPRQQRKQQQGKQQQQQTKNAKKKKIQSKFLEEPWGAFKNKTMKLANKFLSLFTIIQFPNSRCQATSASSVYEGTCYHSTECENLNGTAIGKCADGYGVCCVFRYTCGESSSQNCSYFESPGYPDYYPPGGGTVPPTVTPLPPPTMMPTTFPPETTTEPTTEEPTTPTTMPTETPTPPTPPTTEPGGEEVTPDPRKDLFIHHMKPMFRQSMDDVYNCVFMVYKTSSDVRQMRIDFEDLELSGPTDGTCMDERLIITGQNIGTIVPVICGYNTGQHIYVDVSELSGPLQLAVLSSNMDRKRFKIRICQLADSCSGSLNCLQYYTGIRGVVSSFNYDQSAMFSRSEPGYFNNLNYAICIRREPGYCSITYSNIQNGMEYPFQMINVDDSGMSLIPAGQAGSDAISCPNDYVIINGMRLCGDKFNDGSVTTDLTMNAPVTDTSAGPIVIQVRTDATVTGRGFKLFYMQNPCPRMQRQ